MGVGTAMTSPSNLCANGPSRPGQGDEGAVRLLPERLFRAAVIIGAAGESQAER
jgi:hypothetical protein